MEHKLVGENYLYDYYCTEAGDIYYRDDSHVTQYPTYSIVSREVSAQHHGKSTKYMSVPILYKDGGRAPVVDVAELIARTVFKVPAGMPGFARLHDKNPHHVNSRNIEFVQTGILTGEVVAVWDKDGRTILRPLGKQAECAGSIEKPSMTVLPDKPPMPPVTKKEPKSVKLDLGERDRSVVAELLYSLITEKEMSAADALKVLCIPGGYDTLELYLEGKNIIKERLAKEDTLNQERDKKEPSALDLVETNCEYNGAIVYLNKTNGKAYTKVNGKPKELK